MSVCHENIHVLVLPLAVLEAVVRLYFESPKQIYQRDPEVVVWPTVFWEAWGAKAKNRTFSGRWWLLGLGTPGLQKNSWSKNHFGINLNKAPKHIYKMLIATSMAPNHVNLAWHLCIDSGSLPPPMPPVSFWGHPAPQLAGLGGGYPQK